MHSRGSHPFSRIGLASWCRWPSQLTSTNLAYTVQLGCQQFTDIVFGSNPWHTALSCPTDRARSATSFEFGPFRSSANCSNLTEIVDAGIGSTSPLMVASLSSGWSSFAVTASWRANEIGTGWTGRSCPICHPLWYSALVVAYWMRSADSAPAAPSDCWLRGWAPGPASSHPSTTCSPQIAAVLGSNFWNYSNSPPRGCSTSCAHSMLASVPSASCVLLVLVCHFLCRSQIEARSKAFCAAEMSSTWNDWAVSACSPTLPSSSCFHLCLTAWFFASWHSRLDQVVQR